MKGPWSPAALDRATLDVVREKLCHFEKKTWDESTTSGSVGVKRIALADLPRDATKRLERLKLDDAEALWEFRLQGTQRVWGLRHGDVCYMLWWDPHHSVYPSTKKRT